MNEQQFQEFKDIIREIVREEISDFLKEQGFSRQITAEVLSVSDDNRQCSLDLVDTKLNNILNKSGSSLKVGDTVTISEKYGSNYSNCYISTKNGMDLETESNTTKVITELKNNIKNLEARVTILEKLQ